MRLGVLKEAMIFGANIKNKQGVKLLQPSTARKGENQIRENTHPGTDDQFFLQLLSRCCFPEGKACRKCFLLVQQSSFSKTFGVMSRTRCVGAINWMLSFATTLEILKYQTHALFELIE